MLLLAIGASLLPQTFAANFARTLPLSRLGSSQLDDGWVTVSSRTGTTNIAIELDLKGTIPNVKYTLFFVGSNSGTPVQLPILILLSDDSGRGTERIELAIPDGSYQGQFQVRLNAVPVFATPEISFPI